MELRELVSGQVETVDGSSKVSVATTTMNDSHVGALAVLDRDEVVGIFTERDVVRLIASGGDASADVVKDWMTPYPDMIRADAPVSDAAEWMLAAGYRHLPVVDTTGLIGMASIKDILWALTDEGETWTP